MSQKPTILVAGASGYGNLGDHSYRQVFSKFLSDEYNLIFDAPFPNKDLVDLADYILVGGGGLIYKNDTAHFDYMKMYLERAMHKEIPFSFISCGVQIKNGLAKLDIPTIKHMGIEQIQCWKPYLDKADLITVRSEDDLELIQAVSDNKEAYYFPDAAYALDGTEYSLIPPNAAVFILTPSSVNKHPRFKALWDKYEEEYGDNRYVLAFSTDDYKITNTYGQIIRPGGNLNSLAHLTPAEAIACLKTADRVVTGRYHGRVFARAAGIPNSKIDCIDQRWKSRVEEEMEGSEARERTAEQFVKLKQHLLKIKHG